MKKCVNLHLNFKSFASGKNSRSLLRRHRQCMRRRYSRSIPHRAMCSARRRRSYPSAGMMLVARKVFKNTINVLIRVREGDFVYSDEEKAAMLLDIDTVASTGCNGAVVGALTSDGDIDIEFASKAVTRAHSHGLSITFHRAFDHCKNRVEALEQLISLGYDRVLTSAGADNVVEGIDGLKQLVELASGRIIILPGGGVNADNAATVIETTSATEIHGSCRAGSSSSDSDTIRTIINRINHV